MSVLISWLGSVISCGLFYSPAWLRTFLGNVLAFLWFDVFRIRRRVVLENLKIAFPEMSLNERVRLGRQSLRHLGLNFIEYSFLPRLNKNNFGSHFEFHNLELFEKVLAEGRGVLLLTLHLGHGDLACAGLSLRDYPMVMVSKFFKMAWLNDLWFGMRRRLGTEFIPPRDSSYALLKSLKRGSVVVIPLDQFTGPPIGVKTTFFGRETGTAAGLALMAERSKAPVLAVYTVRTSEGRHAIHFVREMPVHFVEDRQENTVLATQSFNDQLEAFVKLHPEQWMWIHRRWKRFVVL